MIDSGIARTSSTDRPLLPSAATGADSGKIVTFWDFPISVPDGSVNCKVNPLYSKSALFSPRCKNAKKAFLSVVPSLCPSWPSACHRWPADGYEPRENRVCFPYALNELQGFNGGGATTKKTPHWARVTGSLPGWRSNGGRGHPHTLIFTPVGTPKTDVMSSESKNKLKCNGNKPKADKDVEKRKGLKKFVKTSML
jgi:hypothetical protein